MGIGHFLLAYAAGIGFAPFLDLPPFVLLLPPVSAVLWLALRHRRPAALILLAFFLSLGLSRYRLSIEPPSGGGHIGSFAGAEKVAVEGVIKRSLMRPQGRTVIDLETEKIHRDGVAASVHGLLRLYVTGAPLRAEPGDTIRFLTRLRKPRPFGVPGEFDYARHLAAERIFVTAFVRNSREVAVLAGADASDPVLVSERSRARIARFIDSRLRPQAAALVRALAVGDKGGIDKKQRDIMSRGGVAHLFAISGLHLGLIGLLLYAAGRFLYRRSDLLLGLGPPARLLPPLLLPALLAYLFLTGNALPTLRAFLMTLAGALLLCGCRRTPPLKLLAATAFLILLAKPLALFRPAFQLSFAGVLGIVALLGRWHQGLERLPAVPRRAAILAAATVAATVTTTPIVLHHFHVLASAGPIANLFAVPLIGLGAVPFALLGVLALPWSPDLAAVFFSLCGHITETVLAATAWLLTLPGLAGWRLYLTPQQLAGTALLTVAVLLPGQQRQGNARRFGLVAAGLLLLFVALPSSDLRLTALSVGQGESLLLSLDGAHYLIDGGGLYSETFDVGERLVAPSLARLGVRSLEAVLLTHDHPDHRKGLVHVLEHIPVASFWSAMSIDQLHPSLREALARSAVPVRRFEPGWSRLLETETKNLALFIPDQSHPSLNDRSAVLYARNGSDGLLLTGDLEAPGVQELLENPPPGPVSLLKLPHHGSRHAEPQRLLDRLAPSFAFASAGFGNRYRLPHATVVDELRRREIPFYRTDLDGSLHFVSRGDGWHVSCWQRGLFR